MTETNGEAKRQKLVWNRRKKIFLRTLKQTLITQISDTLDRAIEELDLEELTLEKEMLVPPIAKVIDEGIQAFVDTRKKEEKDVPRIPD